MMFVDSLATTVNHMTTHIYISEAQSMHLMNKMESIDSDICIMLDFAENYHYVLQDQIQSFHWNNNQCNIPPAIIYYNDMSNSLQEKLFVFISEDLKHDTAFVYEVMNKVCKYIMQNYQHLQKLSIFLMVVQSNIKITKIS